VPSSDASLEPKQDRSRATRLRLLDAAVDELIDRGYAGFTAQGVAERAGTSRGAQQGHFPKKTTLVAEAVRHLGQLQTAELRETLSEVVAGAARLGSALDVIFSQYSSGRFAAIVELSLAARQNPELREVVSVEERAIAAELHALAFDLFGPAASNRSTAERWTTALSAVRGLALLQLLGHPSAAVHRQWLATREHLIAMLD
jgi:AcrR family transcriptional regulator